MFTSWVEGDMRVRYVRRGRRGTRNMPLMVLPVFFLFLSFLKKYIEKGTEEITGPVCHALPPSRPHGT